MTGGSRREGGRGGAACLAWLAALAACLCLFAGPSSAVPGSRRRPNILFLLSDDQRWNSLGCMGDPLLQTPNLDALAGRGVLFTRACVTTSICCASRASLLTGQYTSRHGIDTFSKPLSEDALARTYPVVLRSYGYYTGFIGKYGVGREVPDVFDYRRAIPQFTPHWVQDAEGQPTHVIDQDTEYALTFLRSRPKERPFCLSLSYRAPHAEDKNPKQYLYKPEDEALYRYAAVPVPGTATQKHFESLPPFLATEENLGRVRWHWRFDTPEKYQAYVKAYYRLITHMDRSVGQVLEELERQGLARDTIVVFMGDNGYFLGEHGLADKWYPHEESIRVPLIVADPRLPRSRQGTRNDDFVLNVDIAPTFLKLAGCPVPRGMQGHDFSPLLRGERPGDWRRDFYYEHPIPIAGIEPSEALVARDLKYVLWSKRNYEELFDLRQDPQEERNVAADPEYRQRLTMMRRRFEERKRAVVPEAGAPTPVIRESRPPDRPGGGTQ